MSHAGSGRTKRVFHLTSLRPRKKSTRSKISRKEARGNGLTTDTGESWKVKRRRIACTIQTGDDNVEGETFDSAGIEASEEDGGFGAIRTDKGKGREVAPRHGDNTVVTGEQSSLKSSASGPELPIPSSVSLSFLSLPLILALTARPRISSNAFTILQAVIIANGISYSTLPKSTGWRENRSDYSGRIQSLCHPQSHLRKTKVQQKLKTLRANVPLSQSCEMVAEIKATNG
jgi:hypothetical protein